MNNFTYSGKVEGEIEEQQRKSGKGTYKVFKGLIGELPIWLFGRSAEEAEKHMGRHVVVNGLLESRTSDNGNVFPQFRIFQVHPTTSTTRVNTILLAGEVSLVKRIKDGLYNVGLDIRGTTWDSENRERVDTTYTIPVNVSSANDSDIGKEATVVATLQVRDGKFTDIVADSFVIEGQGDMMSPPEESSADGLDDLFAQ